YASANVGGFMLSTKSTEVNYYNKPSGNIDEMVLPTQSFTGLTSPTLKFDIAKSIYSASYVDTLKVMVSSDCGTTWTTVYNNNDNSTLNTAGAAVTSDWAPTTAVQWRTETVNLAAFANKPSVIVKFDAISGNGNNLYIDNINIAQATGIHELSNITYMSLYPNPTSSQVTLAVSLASSETISINIFNNMGELVYSETKNSMPAGDSKITLATEGLANGFYSVTLSSKQGYITKKLAVSK
ncbi:MAG TPA: T9SS type A sorting domain-containing protein, partial [Nitrosopumilaceae archaeon]|nr:T9SS type A sorting domain-containing protein [Nitrosopumilaceae archaeon]